MNEAKGKLGVIKLNDLLQDHILLYFYYIFYFTHRKQKIKYYLQLMFYQFFNQQWLYSVYFNLFCTKYIVNRVRLIK